MHAYQREFIQFAIERGVLCFGEFELKSGRISPYFFNAGGFNTGAALARLGSYYAAAIQQAKLDFDVMLGPAYKGIPLVSAASIALANDYERDVPYVFNRKVAKDHGEGGNLVGAALAGRVLIVDDVISAGTAIREVMTLINDAGAKPSAVVIALNRQERGTGDVSAIQQVENDYGIPVASIVGFAELVEYLEEVGGYERHLDAMYEYRRQYGV